MDRRWENVPWFSRRAEDQNSGGGPRERCRLLWLCRQQGNANNGKKKGDYPQLGQAHRLAFASDGTLEKAIEAEKPNARAHG